MTCIVMGKYYIKTGVNVKHGTVQLLHMCDLNAFAGINLSTGGGLTPGAGLPQATLDVNNIRGKPLK